MEDMFAIYYGEQNTTKRRDLFIVNCEEQDYVLLFTMKERDLFCFTVYYEEDGPV